MDVLLIATVAILGVTGIILQLKNATRFIHFYNLLSFAIITMVLLPNFAEASATPVVALIGIAAINFLAAQFPVLRKEYVRAIVPVLSIVSFLLIFQGGTVTFMDADYISVNKFLVGGSIIAVLAFELALVKIKILKKLIDGVAEEDAVTGILLLLLAVALFMGMLASSSFGLLVVIAAFLIASFYRNDNSNRFVTSLLILAVLPHILKLANEDTAVLVDGDVLQGLFVGAFGMFLIQKLWDATKRNAIALFLVYALFLGVSFAILWTGTIFFKMGGMDALAGVFVGVALVNTIVGKGFSGTSIFMLLLTGALIIPSFMVNEEQQAFEEQEIVMAEGGVDKDGNVIAPPTLLPLSEITGDYALVSKSSIVSFTLGEGGKTKGAFKKVNGSVSIGEDVSNSKLDITLPMKNFTTFVPMRDKSLKGDDYFKVNKYPTMKYKATGFTETSENAYELNGDFTMLGVTKKVKVTLQRIEKDGELILIGSGKIDRTKFGMTPDASEGNIVTFNYNVVLK